MAMMGARTSVSRTESAAGLPEPLIRVRSPAGGWHVGFRLQRGGRTVVEVTEEDGSLAGMVTSSRLPILSVDTGWAGFSRARGGDGQWWALAIGHVPAGAGQPDVTFSRRQFGGRLGRAAFPDVVDGLWVVHDGLLGRGRQRSLHDGPAGGALRYADVAPQGGRAWFSVRCHGPRDSPRTGG